MDLKSTLRRFLPKETPRQTPCPAAVPNLDPFLHGREWTPFGPVLSVEEHFAFGDAGVITASARLGAGFLPAGLSILGSRRYINIKLPAVLSFRHRDNRPGGRNWVARS